MSRVNSLVSASLMVALAAGAAGIFTVVTDASSGSLPQVNRTAKADQQDLRSIYFDAQPIAGNKKVGDEAVAPVRPGELSDQILPERTNGQREKMPMMNGCESGLSPDLSPTVAQAGRCLAERVNSSKYASLH